MTSTYFHAARWRACSFLNRAAVITDGDVDGASGSVLRPWRVCTVQQVEELKTVLRIMPLWSAAIVLSVAIGVQINFTILQALAMDRAVGRFTVPAGSMFVGSLMAVVIFLGLLDRVRGGAALPGAGDAVLPGVPAVAQEHGHGHDGHDRGAGVLPEHRPHQRRPARHHLAAGQHERVQAGEPLLAAHRARRRQLGLLPYVRQAVQVPEHRQVAQAQDATHSLCMGCVLAFGVTNDQFGNRS
uniref:Uncharacterized protein n=1 Tax=Aegilops tauschii subsp. strangulata TaxID=200361 RepID=A0A453QSV2_AEGTS